MPLQDGTGLTHPHTAVLTQTDTESIHTGDPGMLLHSCPLLELSFLYLQQSCFSFNIMSNNPQQQEEGKRNIFQALQL